MHQHAQNTTPDLNSCSQPVHVDRLVSYPLVFIYLRLGYPDDLGSKLMVPFYYFSGVLYDYSIS